MKVEKVVVAPAYKLEVSLEEMNDIRMAVCEASIDPNWLPGTRERMKALYGAIRDNA